MEINESLKLIRKFYYKMASLHVCHRCRHAEDQSLSHPFPLSPFLFALVVFVVVVVVIVVVVVVCRCCL